MWNLKRVIVIALMLVVNVLVIWNIFFQNDTKGLIFLFVLFCLTQLLSYLEKICDKDKGLDD
ncbi:hypothetical protein D7I45_00060 [Apilactobacillus bombintestini]|uniref:Uncharacterized protein n=2 Tax=Apilactobacillus bombintestini TaxID=2419772 RepID=A0A387APS7_9LACO|nr:hypothetical protein D7I45_00060 [Apilactobacillus bombintestini]